MPRNPLNHTRSHWSVMRNGERVGRPFPTWEGGKESLWRMVDRLHYQSQRLGPPDHAAHNGREKGRLLANYINGERMTPRPELQASIYDEAGNLLNLRLKRERL